MHGNVALAVAAVVVGGGGGVDDPQLPQPFQKKWSEMEWRFASWFFFFFVSDMSCCCHRHLGMPSVSCTLGQRILVGFGL
jgi:hypothetical protein